MSGYLNGTVLFQDTSSLLIVVHDVGYKVWVPTSVLAQYGNKGVQVQLFIYTHVREDVLELYGFTDPHDLKMFEQLISVSGVGCRTALGIFSVGSRNDIIKAIKEGNVAFFTAGPRLGKKNGQKIIIELKNKIGATEDLDLSDTTLREQDDIVGALQALGYSLHESLSAAQTVKGKDMPFEQKIKLALKQLAK